MGAYFYIEYDDGRVTQIEFRKPTTARKAYELYCKEPEPTARGYGWEVKSSTPTLEQQIRARKAAKVA